MTISLLLTIIFYICTVIYIFFSVFLRSDYSPSSRLLWFIIVVFFPFAGLLAYTLFSKYKLWRSERKISHKIFDEIYKKSWDKLWSSENCDKLIDEKYINSFKYASSINKFYTLNNNWAELMADAKMTRERIVEDIDSAVESVNIIYYIWLDDNTGNDVANALIRAVKRWVVCRIMVDYIGSRKFLNSDIWNKMKEAGVKTAVALPIKNIIKTIVFSRIDMRNHRKITIIDSKITYCWSQNCADPEFLVKKKYAPWVDIMLRVEWPVVAQNQLLFMSDWLKATDEKYDDFKFNNNVIEGGFPAQIWWDWPTERTKSTPQLFSTLINCAIKTLTISTPYFVPDTTVIEALCSASYRWIKVTVIFPEKNDSWVVSAVSHWYYEQLLKSWVVIYEYVGWLLHAKTLTIDNKISLIGSTNIDLRSFDLNYENDILLQDTKITNDIFNRQQYYISKSKLVLIEDVKKWPISRRIWNNFMATVWPIL